MVSRASLQSTLFLWPFYMFQADDRNDMTNSGIMFLGWLAKIETC